MVTLSTAKSTEEDAYCDEIPRNQKREKLQENQKRKEETIPLRIILRQEEAVEDELALVNRRTLNLNQNLEKIYRSKKRKAETSDSSPSTMLRRQQLRTPKGHSTEAQIENDRTGRYEIGFIGSANLSICFYLFSPGFGLVWFGFFRYSVFSVYD